MSEENLKNWKIKELNEDLSYEFSNSLKIPNHIASLLVLRGIEDLESAKKFLEPSLENIKPPIDSIAFLKACQIVLDSYKLGHKVYIFGDYDVDGTCSTVILYDFLNKLGMDVSFYLPDRFKEGYGLNIEAADFIISQGAKLVITVDCGISNYEEVKHLKQNGITVIVTDHHSLPLKLPESDVILHSALKECLLSFNSFAGVGIAFYFLITLRRFLTDKGIISAIDSNTKFNLKKYLDVVALATIADVVPLIDENRILVKKGLEVIKNTEKPGLFYLKQLSGVYGDISTFDVGFKLAPRLNAAGRMGAASRVVDLLTSENESQALSIARELHLENNNRKKVQDSIMESIESKISQDGDMFKKSIIIHSRDWHEGIIGICASKLVDKYNVPAIILSFSEKSSSCGEVVLKGSGRSIPGLNLHEALASIDSKSNVFEKYGGHSAAVGLSIKKSNFDIFVKEFNDYLDINLKDEDYVPRGHVDLELTFSEIDLGFIKHLNKLEPFGEGNSLPLFITNGLIIEDFRIIKEKHWKGFLVDPTTGVGFEAIAFNMAKKFEGLKENLSIIYSLEINSFNNIDRIQINIKDVINTI